jgi:hypothetical protein
MIALQYRLLELIVLLLTAQLDEFLSPAMPHTDAPSTTSRPRRGAMEGEASEERARTSRMRSVMVVGGSWEGIGGDGDRSMKAAGSKAQCGSAGRCSAIKFAFRIRSSSPTSFEFLPFTVDVDVLLTFGVGARRSGYPR